MNPLQGRSGGEMSGLSDTRIRHERCNSVTGQTPRTVALQIDDANEDFRALTGMCNALMLSGVIWAAIVAVFF
jgi:hypothetical protein